MKKKIAIALLMGIVAASTLGGVASAHVHGITPLRDLVRCGVASPNSGALVADDHSDVIRGLIPRDVGNAPLAPGDGGFGETPFDAATGECTPGGSGG